MSWKRVFAALGGFFLTFGFVFIMPSVAVAGVCTAAPHELTEKGGIPEGYVDAYRLVCDSQYQGKTDGVYNTLYQEQVTGFYLLLGDREEEGMFWEDDSLILESGETASYEYSYMTDRDEIEYSFSDITMARNDETGGYTITYSVSGHHTIYMDRELIAAGTIDPVEIKVKAGEYTVEYGGETGPLNNYYDFRIFLGFEMEAEEGASNSMKYHNVEFTIAGVKQADAVVTPAPGGGSTTINTQASATAGEAGESVPAAVVVGVGSVVAAVGAAGAAGAAGSGRGRSEDELEEASEYRLLVRKDFGNRLRVNRPEQPVYARMEEIKPGGQVVARPDLTGQIQIFAGSAGMVVRNNQMSGDYVGAFIGAESPNNQPVQRQGVVSFRFVGQGGVFQNNVSFDVVGDPYLEFFAGPGATTGVLRTAVKMIAGDGLTYHLDFMTRDFVDAVTNVQVTVNSPAALEAKWEQVGPEAYRVSLKNITAPVAAGVFSKAQHYWFNVLTHNQWEKAETQVDVYVYPPGLRVHGPVQDDNLVVDTVPPTVPGGVGKIVATKFQLQLAVADVSPNGPKVELLALGLGDVAFAQMKGKSTEAEVMLGKFSYVIQPCEFTAGASNVTGAGGFSFLPALTLPGTKTGNYGVLPVEANYKGQRLQAEIPVWLKGVMPDPMAGWDEEYARFQRFVSYFGLGTESAMQARDVVKNRSTAELRLLNKAILYETMNYYTQEGIEFNHTADIMSRLIVASKIFRAFGDQAFSVLMWVYFGPFWDAVLTPFKELLADFIGEASAVLMVGGEMTWENLRLSKHLDDLITMNILAVMRDPANGLRYAGKIAAGYGMFSLVNNYVNNLDDKGNRSFYNAVTGCFKDLSALSLKVYVGRYVQKMIQNPKLLEESTSYIDRLLRWLLPDLSKMNDRNILAAVVRWQKRIEGIAGLGAVTVINAITGKVSSSSLLPKAIELTSSGVRIWFKEANGQVGIEIALSRLQDVLWGMLYMVAWEEYESYFDPPPPPIDPPYDPKYPL